MTDPLDPDDTKVDFDEPTTSLVLLSQGALLLGSNCQCELKLLLLGERHNIVYRTPILLPKCGDRVLFNDIPLVKLEVHKPKYPGVAILQHGMVLHGYSVA